MPARTWCGSILADSNARKLPGNYPDSALKIKIYSDPARTRKFGTRTRPGPGNFGLVHPLCKSVTNVIEHVQITTNFKQYYVVKIEGKNILNVIKHLKNEVKSNYQILICYDNDTDDLFKYENQLFKINNNIKFVKNNFFGPCGAVKTGLISSSADAMIVYPADDLINGNILDEMYRCYLEGYDIVAPSRFMKGGSMKNCPLIKEILVRFASFSLFKLSGVPSNIFVPS